MNKIRAILVPGAVFQSVIVGGAYGTGREVVEYISRFGALGGLWVIAVVALVFGLILAASMEFARVFQANDYRRFLSALLGRAWILYELMFALLLVVIMAIVAAAAGSVLADAFSLPPAFGTAALFTCVVLLNYLGRTAVERTLTLGAIALTSSLIIYCVIVFSHEDTVIVERLRAGSSVDGWWLSGIKFAVYNSALVPVIIYCSSNLSNRSSALAAGALAALMGVLPALLFHLSFVAGLPYILQEDLPTYWMLEQFASTICLPIYAVILFATIVQTGVGILQGLNERLDGWYEDTHGEKLSSKTHAIIAAAILLLSFFLSKLGLVTLIARGYGTLAWGFFFVFSAPLLTYGVYKIVLAEKRSATG